MKKVRSNASWNRLTSEQRETLDRWLFEKNLGYAKVLPKAVSELGYQGSETSLRRYYERRKQERLLTDIKQAGSDMAEVRGLDADPDAPRKASMQVLGVYLFRALRENPDSLKELMPVVKAMLQNDFNETLRESKAEDRKLREKALEFAKEKFEFGMTEKALKALPALNELAQARKDPRLTRYEENARRNRLRRAMFGVGQAVEPESAQEEAEMRAAKQEREERRRRQSQAQPAGESLVGPPVPSNQYYEEYMEAKVAEEKRQTSSSQAPSTQVAAVADLEQAAGAKSDKGPEVSTSESVWAEREKLRQQQVSRGAGLEEVRELCGGQELQRPPGGLEPH